MSLSLDVGVIAIGRFYSCDLGYYIQDYFTTIYIDIFD